MYFIVVGGLLLALYLLWIQPASNRGSGSDNCPFTLGTIVDSELKKCSTGGGPGSSSNSGVKVRFQYEYTVDGITHTNDRLRFGVNRCQTSNAAEDIARNDFSTFPVGADITVYYDPADPQESVLVKGTAGLFGTRIGWLFGAAFVFLVLPAISVVYGFIKKLWTRNNDP